MCSQETSYALPEKKKTVTRKLHLNLVTQHTVEQLQKNAKLAFKTRQKINHIHLTNFQR